MPDEATSAAATLEVPSSTNTSEPLTYEAAVARKAELMAKPGFAQRWVNGELDARREFGELTAALAKGPSDPAKEARAISVAGNGYLSDYQKSEFVNQEPITREVAEQAKQMHADLIKDPEFFRKWSSYDRDARRRLSLLAQVLSRPVKD